MNGLVTLDRDKWKGFNSESQAQTDAVAAVRRRDVAAHIVFVSTLENNYRHWNHSFANALI